MTHDELRKRVFELECGLGTAIKISEQLKDELEKRNRQQKQLTDIIDILTGGIKAYLATMNKHMLSNCVDSVREYSKNLIK